MFAKLNFDKGLSLTLVTEEELGGTPYNLYRGRGGCDILVCDIVLVEVRGMKPDDEKSLVNVKMQIFDMKTPEDLRGVYHEVVIKENGDLSVATNLSRANLGIPKRLFQKLWVDKDPKSFLAFIDLVDREYRKQPGIAEYGSTFLDNKDIHNLHVQMYITMNWY